MKAVTYLLVGGVLALGTACGSANTSMGSASTSGSSTGTSTSMDATSGTSSSGSGTTSGSGGSTGVIGSGAGADASIGTSGATSTSGATGSSAAPGTDLNAFMASFATMEDPTFLMTAASSNLLEIQMGQLAVQKSTNADVKKFGQMMVDHHTKATQELKTVATPLGVTLPQTMMPVHQAMADKLTGKSGKAFDEDYMDAMEMAHKMDIAMFETKSKASAAAPVVKSFATKTLPMLRSHSTMASDIEKKVD